MILKLLIIVGSISAILSTKPCKTPDQWEGKYYSYDALRRIRIIGKISYDAVNNRERVLQHIIMPDRNQTYDLLYLYTEKVLEVFDVTNEVCHKMHVTKPWTDFGVPKDAVYFGKEYYGSSVLKNNGLLVNTWKDEYVDSKGNKVIHVSTWTDDACIPILDNYVTDEYSLHCMFMDITPGIKDESIFEPREQCSKVEEE